MEFTAPPVTGRVFSHEHPNLLSDCDPSGRLRLDGIARILHDAATLDNEGSPAPDKGLWILRRLVIELDEWPRYLDTVLTRTWCSGIGRAWAERRSDLYRHGHRIAQAKALWVNVAPETGFPRSLPEGFLEVFGPSAAGRTIKPRFELPVPDDEPMAHGELPLRYSDLDIVDHVNNAVHLALVEELLAPKGRGIASAVPQYQSIVIEFHEALQTPDPAVYSMWYDDQSTMIRLAQVTPIASVTRLAKVRSLPMTDQLG